MTSRNELLTALRDAREGWLPLTGKVFTITLDPEERDMLIEALSARPEALQKDRILAALRKLQFTNGDVHINGRSIGGHWNKHLQGFIDEVESALSPLARSQEKP